MEETVEILQQYEQSKPYVTATETYKRKKYNLFSQFYPKRTSPIEFASGCKDIFVVSDLHIAAGKTYAGIYGGTENFFADESFKRFLDYANKKNGKALLILNGDTFDFLRIVDHPLKKKTVRFSKWIKHPINSWRQKKHNEVSTTSVEKQFAEWSKELKKVGIDIDKNDLEGTITDSEIKYGLGTEGFKTIYKLFLIKQGHPIFIEALSTWLEKGNKLMFVKGNHDLELYWSCVRNYIRVMLAEDIDQRNGTNNRIEILKKKVLDNVTFIDDSVVVDDGFYVEHGHRYDKFCTVLDNPVLDENKDQIKLPFGSFFNRYLINRVEMFFPFIDNVRPASNVLPLLIKTNFPLALKILFQHVPLLLKLLLKNFRYARFMANKIFWYALALIVPVGLLIALNINDVKNFLIDFFEIINMGGILGFVIDQITNVALLILSYFLARLVGWFQLTEPSCLDKFGKERFEGTNYKIIAMAHTHNPGQYYFDDEHKFYNSGTWIPIIETSTAEVREDKTYTFLHLSKGSDNKLTPAQNGLERWNDDAVRADSQVLIRRK